MICKFATKNFLAFKDKVEIDFTADGRTKKFLCNCIDSKNKYYIKTLGIYGPNNTGKTCLFLGFSSLIGILNPAIQNPQNFHNVFGDETNTEFEVEFISNDRKYNYFVVYDSTKSIFVKERLSFVYENPANPSDRSLNTIVEKNENGLFVNGAKVDDSIASISFDARSSVSVMNLFNFSDPKATIAKSDFYAFINSFIFISTNYPINIQKTIDLMKDDKEGYDFIKTFIKDCDLNIEDLTYSEQVVVLNKTENKIANFINNNPGKINLLQINSQHHGLVLPSQIIDSEGTRQLIALSAYVYDALKNGKILVIDELDRSLHHLITRALISLFNNEDNKRAQLIFTTHDLMLLNIKTLLRKEQIVLTDIDSETKFSTATQFSKFTAEEYGIRGNEDITDYYMKGRFGSIPNPDLYNCLKKVKQ